MAGMTAAGAALSATALSATACTPAETASVGQIQAAPDAAYLAIVHGADPAAITEAAVQAVGGIARFVSKGDDVIVKPNICVNYQTFEYAATTNPTVVGTLVRLCLEAGRQPGARDGHALHQRSRDGLPHQRHL